MKRIWKCYEKFVYGVLTVPCAERCFKGDKQMMWFLKEQRI